MLEGTQLSDVTDGGVGGGREEDKIAAGIGSIEMRDISCADVLFFYPRERLMFTERT